ncbi:hypothetical protein OV079_51275 [Nannocystis pusilla]|uniref:Uncharacterized protein n=1 Tax=Nannocystis pusilla TaxID=889268 RepID=A0A9X3F0I4_9BACT|nr:hypothetical protein [Nannocystis pusilla]MCY1013774.1 hypothetical protein [Nannocystis pusilla]
MPRKKTRRRRRRTPRPAVWHYDPPDELEELLGALDIEDELVMLLDDAPGPRAHPQQRPVRMGRDDLVRSPLSQSWAARATDCGAGVARLARGLDYLLSGALLDLQVSRGRLAALVQGSRRYRVVVDVLLPPAADMRAALERVQGVRAAAPPGTEPRLAVQQAIVAGGSHLFRARRSSAPSAPVPTASPASTSSPRCSASASCSRASPSCCSRCGAIRPPRCARPRRSCFRRSPPIGSRSSTTSALSSASICSSSPRPART